MIRGLKGKLLTLSAVVVLSTLSTTAFPSNSANPGSDEVYNPQVVGQIFKSAEANNNWKLAFLTGKNAQIVFMNVSPATNPQNEIGMETHPFDQVILLVQGSGKALLNGKESAIKAGDLIFIPQGIQHNIINSNPNLPLKLISFYSNRDIPANAAYKTKAEAP
ncbi:MAG TPA: cupin domain-containing protein [Gammaproteobacteria bacterium]|nr:cupin domain-containing protein [Gammaproteobacteria bacterium]